jgi:hypothetical protein
MKLSWGMSLLFYASLFVALLASLWEGQAWRQVGLQGGQKSWVPLLGSLTAVGVLCGLAATLQLEIASAWPCLLISAGLFGLLARLNFSAETRGVILLTFAFAFFSQFSDLTAMPLALLASFLGLTLGKIWNPKEWIDFLWPATWIVGLYWLITSMPESALLPQAALLSVFVAIGLVARTGQALPALKNTAPTLAALFTVITGGLAAWLAVQNLLLQPAFMPWVGLFAGGLALGYLLWAPTVNPTHFNAKAESPAAPTLGSLPAGGIALALIGVAALVASRLFGTLGWVVLVAGLLSNRRTGSLVSVAGLFLLGRVLLQVFLTQYNANVTGINITHPYASAALYLGFAIMLSLPGWLNLLNGKNYAISARPVSEELETDADEQSLAGAVPLGQTDFSMPSVSLLILGPLLMAGLSNYFLHAEATASLLLALLVAGLGVSLLVGFKTAKNRGIPLFLCLFSVTGALASPDVLNWGNQAEKGQKLTVLAVALIVILLAGFLAQRTVSGRKPVQVS